MLHHTFCHIQGIGLATEQRLWQSGIRCWQDWPPAAPLRLPISPASLTTAIAQSQAALADNPAFFTSALAAGEQWRIFPQYRSQTAYIDIETTGLDGEAELTVVSLYDGQEVRVYVNGRNLDDFPDDVARFKVLVSYNGKSFDIPFLERYFRIRLNQAQIDLRYVLAKLGYRGGLKGCEKMLGIHRPGLDQVDGYFAVLLWQEYQHSHDPQALETLLAYNIEDTVNLERLAIMAYNQNIAATPFADVLALPLPAPPLLPHHADLACIARIRRKYGLS